jgi:hypothetical protein
MRAKNGRHGTIDWSVWKPSMSAVELLPPIDGLVTLAAPGDNCPGRAR